MAQAGDVVGRVSRVAKAAASVAGAGAVQIAHGASHTARVGAELARLSAHDASRAAHVGKKIGMIAGLGALVGTAMLAAGGLAVAGRVAVMADMRRRLRADPALGAAAAREGVSVRREIGSASPRYHSAPWSTERVDDVARDLEGRVPRGIHSFQPQPLPDSYRSQPRPGLLTRLGQMRWVIGSAPARPTPTHARQPASSQPTDRVDRGPAAPALPTPSPTESRPPPAPERPQTAMDFLRGRAVPKDTTRKGPSL